MSNQPTKGHTYLFDPEDPTELARLLQLDQIVTEAMGGPLAGLSDLPHRASVLDLACGPGGWVMDAAFELPDCEVAGVDISQSMIRYALTRARSQRLTNARFEVMDITRPLDFSAATFDLINARLLVGVLKRETWTSLLAECWRLLRPGGLLRVTEPVDLGETSSPAYHRLSTLCCQALRLSGYGFSAGGGTPGITYRLPRLLRQANYHHLHCQGYTLEVSRETGGWAGFYHNLEIAGNLVQPVLVKAGLSTAQEARHLYQQAIIEVYDPDFCGLWQWLSCTAQKPIMVAPEGLDTSAESEPSGEEPSDHRA